MCQLSADFLLNTLGADEIRAVARMAADMERKAGRSKGEGTAAQQRVPLTPRYNGLDRSLYGAGVAEQTSLSGALPPLMVSVWEPGPRQAAVVTETLAVATCPYTLFIDGR